MKPFYKLSLLATMLAACGVAHAIPKITIGPMYEFIDGDKSTLQKRIRNQGEDTAYVRVEVREITYLMGNKKQERPINTQEAARGNVDGLIFTPARMIIPAKSMQSGRMVVSGDRTKERYYRVRFIPVMPKDHYEFGQTQKEFDNYKSKVNAGVSVLTGYGAMVVVRPQNMIFNTRIEEQGQNIIVSNNGNSSVQLDAIKNCRANSCPEGSSAIVLPGSVYTLKKESTSSLQFTLLEGNKKTPKKFG